MSERYRPLIDAAARKHGVPATRIAAIIQAESGGNPRAASPAGAQGLMQLMPATARELGVSDPLDPAQNIEAGTRYYRQMLDEFGGDERLALAAYNAGPDAVRKYGGVPPYKETRAYIPRVLGVSSREDRSPFDEALARYRERVRGEQNVPNRKDQALDAMLERYRAKQAGAPLEAETPGPAPLGAPAPESPVPGDTDITPQDPARPLPPGVISTAPTSPALKDIVETPTPPDRLARVVAQGAPPDVPRALPPGISPVPPAFTTAAPPPERDALVQGLLRGELSPGIEPGSPEHAALVRQAVQGYGVRPETAIGTAIGMGVPGLAVRGAGVVFRHAGPMLRQTAGVISELVGNIAARRVNVAIGAEEPGALGDALSLLPTAVRGARAAVPAIAKRLPGASAALHEEAFEGLQRMPETMHGPTTSAALYAQVAQVAPVIPSNPLRQGAQAVLAHEMRLGARHRNPDVVQFAKDLDQLVGQHPGGVPIDLLEDHRKRLGEHIANLKQQGTRLTGLNRLYAAYYDNYDAAAAAGIPGAALIKAANSVARKEFALDDLAEMFLPGKPGVRLRSDNLIELHGGQLQSAFQKRLRTDRIFRDSFTPDEIADIEETLKATTTLRRIPSERSAAGAIMGTAGRGGLAYGATLAAGGGPGAALVAGSVAAGLPPLIAQALMTPTGRRALRAITQTYDAWDAAALGALAAVVRQQAPGEVPQQPISVIPPGVQR